MKKSCAAKHRFRHLLIYLGIYLVIPAHSYAEEIKNPDNPDSDPNANPEMLLKVSAARNLIQPYNSARSTTIDHKTISALPKGESSSLQDIIAQTTSGVTQSTFGVLSVKGMFSKIQYSINGIPLPDSANDYLGDAFNAQNIDSIEMITGSYPAEYGNRLGAVANITTKSGSETPIGMATLTYGSFNKVATSLLYGGANTNGDFQYLASAQFSKTDRGLDTVAPVNSSNVTQGSTEVVHDQSNLANLFFKGTWQVDNLDQLVVTASESYKYFQIPNYPSSYSLTDSLFQQPDIYENSPYYFQPAATNDFQNQNEAFLQAAWKHTFNDRSLLKLAPFYKYSNINFTNDPTNDLFSVYGPTPIAGAAAASYSKTRHINNLGVQTDFKDRLGEDHVFKLGTRVVALQAAGTYNLMAGTTGSPIINVTDSGTNTAYLESFYIQDDFTIFKPLTLSAGLRFDAMQFSFPDVSNIASQLEPRVGLNYRMTESTLLHVYYGKFFQPPPVENFYKAFLATASLGVGQCQPGIPCTYDIKPETDDYFEGGIDQQIGNYLFKGGVYLRKGNNTLDDQLLLNTNLVQPINYIESNAYGLETSFQGKIDQHWSEFINYAYGISRVRGVNGGAFAMPVGHFPSGYFVNLDQEQLHTLNSALIYTDHHIGWTLQFLYGSGYHSGRENIYGLPEHLTANTTLGYNFRGDSWLSHFKLSLDLTNIFDNHYPIQLGTHFNANAYAAGREVFLSLTGQI